MAPTSHEAELAAIRGLIGRGRFEEAYIRCVPLGKGGWTAAQLYLGWMYQSGKGVQRDLDEAEGWYQRAVHSDPQRAEFYLASVYMEKHDFQQALEWFERSASRGYAAATYQLGRIYRFGVGVGVDRQRGFEYIEQAAQKGHLFARRDIAREMLRGHRGLSRIPSGLFVARECGLECL